MLSRLLLLALLVALEVVLLVVCERRRLQRHEALCRLTRQPLPLRLMLPVVMAVTVTVTSVKLVVTMQGMRVDGKCEARRI